MRQKQMPVWLAIVIFLGVGAVFLIVGILLLRHHSKLDKLCDDEAVATIVEVLEHSDDEGTTYAPVYEFTYGGQLYRVESSTYRNPPLYSVGDRADVRLRSDKPTEILDPKEKPTIGIVFTILGGAFVLFSLTAGVVCVCSQKKLKIEN